MAESEVRKFSAEEVRVEFARLVGFQIEDNYGFGANHQELGALNDLLHEPKDDLLEKIYPYRDSLLANLPPLALRRVTRMVLNSPYADNIHGLLFASYTEGRIHEKENLRDHMNPTLRTFHGLTEYPANITD